MHRQCIAYYQTEQRCIWIYVSTFIKQFVLNALELSKMRFLQIQCMTNCFQPQRQYYKLRQHINVLFRLLSMCNHMNHNCLTAISGCNNLPSLKLCPHRCYFKGGKSDSPFSLFLFSVSVSIYLFCSLLSSIRCLNAVQHGLSSNRNADDTGPAAVLPPSPSLGLLLYREGNKDTRRISVVCLTKWLPESEKAMPMGSTTTLLRSTLFCRGPPLLRLP